ncbi:wax ester/triacylglycerol synthase family O-acyltransferase [Nocardioides houyundeii]|uniref:wax ester/triacylglycerol synthase family O-acyltransferase n=1 Tax=Nocardioides houyundeii TaxID=2045452 RepID=UPI000C7727D9|nr:wax ester/triacylglycerol synthase family O-acyltransferase [Nocardioides houyundeii]
MRRLNGEDAGFLYMDLPQQAMCSMALGVLGGDGPPLSLADVRRHVEARLDQLPSWRWRIVRVPLGLHHPVAVRDPHFDLDQHLQAITIEGDAGLDAAFASLAEEHLDPDRPLWQVTLVDGLDDGRQALITKYHHALADGVAGLTTFARIYSDEEFEPLPDAEPNVAERIPGKSRLVGAALLAHLRALVTVVGLVLGTVRGAARVRARRRVSPVQLPAFSGAAPRTVLNDAFTPARTYARAALPLAGIKRIKEVAGVTVNDVVLGVMAGALVRYLARVSEVPERPLLTTVPVSSEPPDAPVRQAHNRFWSFTTSLATDVADPWERLARISAYAGEGKRQLDLFGVDLMPSWLDVVPPLLAEPGARKLPERLREATTDVDANILISNVRGPARPLRLLGRTVEDLYVDGPPSNGVGCNVMLWSYGDRMLLGILAFADALTDPSGLCTAIGESYAELVALADEHAALATTA